LPRLPGEIHQFFDHCLVSYAIDLAKIPHIARDGSSRSRLYAANLRRRALQLLGDLFNRQTTPISKFP